MNNITINKTKKRPKKEKPKWWENKTLDRKTIRRMRYDYLTKCFPLDIDFIFKKEKEYSYRESLNGEDVKAALQFSGADVSNFINVLMPFISLRRPDDTGLSWIDVRTLMSYLSRNVKLMFSTIFGSKIELVPLLNRKIDVFDEFWVKIRVGTSSEPQNRCFQ